ncbi:hypothetical protein VCRA2117O380_60258 [Vibrio crassostreae]|nr:hypothetical protein VCRA2119O382_60259 [Vibrio crassostreae]CAK2184944.1 hypothetical protein VCRA2117O380_60258 [Vibrio crassostreae]CAK2189996.1 hypothetical protein VCRA2119O381_60109 [Vibrio crassostreae]CAK2476061.1 hypothetical protein VCRA2113O360_20260 [Vibrio crassostreae]CAK2539344.1 hypothetical protein VCRA2113O350_60258 [Vibrio crassostreae]
MPLVPCYLMESFDSALGRGVWLASETLMRNRPSNLRFSGITTGPQFDAYSTLKINMLTPISLPYLLDYGDGVKHVSEILLWIIGVSFCARMELYEF